MSPDEMITLLNEKEIIETIANGDSIRLSSEFKYHVERRATQIEEQDDSISDEYLLSSIDDEEFNAIFASVSERFEEFSTDMIIKFAIIIEQLYRGYPTAEGAPAAFLPIRGDQIETLLEIVPRAVLYIWLDDCEPCNSIKQEYDKLLPKQPENIALLSVYGPKWARSLSEQFDIHGGPVSLFILNGNVDTRLFGPHDADAIKHELEFLGNSSV
jgi:hypothetical protein